LDKYFEQFVCDWCWTMYLVKSWTNVFADHVDYVDRFGKCIFWDMICLVNGFGHWLYAGFVDYMNCVLDNVFGCMVLVNACFGIWYVW
jgi:hypothetical protein